MNSPVALALAAELGRVAGEIDAEMRDRAERQEPRVADARDSLAAIESALADLDHRLTAVEGAGDG